MGAWTEYADCGGGEGGRSLNRRRWRGDGVVGRSARGGEKMRWEVVRSWGRRQDSRYTSHVNLVCIGW